MNEIAANLEQLRRALPVLRAEHDALPADSLFRPSAMWAEYGAFLNFVFDLSDANLRDIRLHTAFMTGMPWFENIGKSNVTGDHARLAIPMIAEYHGLTHDIPERFWASEPVTTRLSEALGLRYKGRLVTADLCRFQRCVSNLYWTGVYRHLDAVAGKPVIVEIGAGYGGLAHQVVAGLERPCTYLIFDLPEMLYWSAAFLIVNNPGRSFYIYRGRDDDADDLARVCADYDFVFMPNFLFERVRELPGIDLGLNLLSFQEMTDAQVAFYASIVAERLTGVLYSENFSKHPFSTELLATVDDHLSRWFALTPPPSMWHRLYPNANSCDHPLLMWQLFPYVGTLRTRPATLTPVDQVIHLAERRYRLDREHIVTPRSPSS